MTTFCFWRQRHAVCAAAIGMAFFAFAMHLDADDMPQWGQAWSRNMVSGETNLPDSFDTKTGRNIKWVADLGTETHSTPVIANGRVYIGTNNGQPRDSKHKGDRGVLMVFDETDGHLLWQLVIPKRVEDPYFDWPNAGMSSPATVEGDRVYMLNNRGVVMCLDAHGLANGNDGPFRDEGAVMVLPGTTPLAPGPTDADVIWQFDLVSGAGIWSHDAAHASILVDGPYLYLNTSTGVDNTHRVIRKPDAPSLVVLDKATGRLVARDGEHISPQIFHCTWSSPALGVVNGQRLIFFGGGDGVVYAFAALPLNDPPPAGEVVKLRTVWKFDCDPTAPKENIHSYLNNRREGPSNIKSMPVFYKNRVYVTAGGDIWWGKVKAWLKCIDATKTGDITSSGELWSVPLERHVASTPAIDGGLVYVADCGHNVHGVDAETGRVYWTQDVGGEVWASTLVADGKVYIGTRSGEFWILQAGKEQRVVSHIKIGEPIDSSPVAANGTLYVGTMRHLYAIQEEGN